METIFPYITGMVMMVAVWRLISKELEAPPLAEPESLGDRLAKKRAKLESKGREIAARAGVEFVELEEGWQPEYSIVRYWFRDSEGRLIVASDIDELKWKLEAIGRYR